MIAELIIRNATSRDADDIEEIELKSFAEPWLKETILHNIEFNETVTVIVAVSNNKVIGYIDVQVVMDECDVRRIAVHPDYRGTRIAAILMQAMIHITEQCGVQSHYLEVRESNSAAIGLYSIFGFMENGRRVKYYGDEDAVMMLRIGDPGDADPAMKS